MAQTIVLKSNIFPILPVTPSAVLLGADRTVVAGVNPAVWTLPRLGPCLVLALLKMKAVGTVINIQARLANNAGCTTGLQNGVPIIEAASTYFANIPIVFTMEAISDQADTGFFTIFNGGTLTGTYTFDYRFEYYPIQ